MDPVSSVKLLRLINSPSGQFIMKGIKSGSPDFMNLVLSAIGLESPEQSDYDELAGAIEAYSKATKENKPSAKALAKEMEARRKAIRNVMVDGPGKLALKTLATGVGEGFDAASDITTNTGNRLAQAILASRHGDDRYDSVYGRSGMDKLREMYAINRQRKGENLGRGLKAVGNTVNKGLGMYNAQDAMSKTLESAPIMGTGTPSSIYQAMASANAHSKKLGY